MSLCDAEIMQMISGAAADCERATRDVYHPVSRTLLRTAVLHLETVMALEEDHDLAIAAARAKYGEVPARDEA